VYSYRINQLHPLKLGTNACHVFENAAGPRGNQLFEEFAMHDVLIGLAFVAMIVCPAIVAAIPKSDTEDDA
jgi:hypothetical protein